MPRLVLLASFGVLAIRPVFAQQAPPAQLSTVTKPGSSIALSSFALAQRDEARTPGAIARPTLQASIPAQTPQVPASPTAHSKTVTPVAPSKVPTGVHATGMALPEPPAKLSSPLAPPLTTPKVVAKSNSPTAVITPKVVSLPETPAVQPKVLASREAMRQRVLLSQLDADLSVGQSRLDRAQSRLAQSQHQLGAFTSTLRSAMMEAGDEGNGLHPFVRVAQRYLGTPYVWGGESARGFDCSGFIMRVMRDLGYRALPHSAAEQFHYGTPIARELLKPGDIVFFANTYKPGVSHVGIYLGRGRFIHAANSKVGTIVSSLDEPKWVEHYAGARRLIRADS